MDTDKRHALIQRARTFWEGSEKRKSVDLLYEAIPLELRPEWLIRIIMDLQKLIPASKPIQDVIALAHQPLDWNETKPHPILYAVRDAGEQQNDLMHQYIHIAVYRLGKQIINVKGYPAPFDHTDLFLVPDLLYRIAALTDEPNSFLELIWKLMSDARFIQLETSVPCNRGCPTCFARFSNSDT